MRTVLGIGTSLILKIGESIIKASKVPVEMSETQIREAYDAILDVSDILKERPDKKVMKQLDTYVTMVELAARYHAAQRRGLSESDFLELSDEWRGAFLLEDIAKREPYTINFSNLRNNALSALK